MPLVTACLRSNVLPSLRQYRGPIQYQVALSVSALPIFFEEGSVSMSQFQICQPRLFATSHSLCALCCQPRSVSPLPCLCTHRARPQRCAGPDVIIFTNGDQLTGKLLARDQRQRNLSQRYCGRCDRDLGQDQVHSLRAAVCCDSAGPACHPQDGGRRYCPRRRRRFRTIRSR